MTVFNFPNDPYTPPAGFVNFDFDSIVVVPVSNTIINISGSRYGVGLEVDATYLTPYQNSERSDAMVSLSFDEGEIVNSSHRLSMSPIMDTFDNQNLLVYKNGFEFKFSAGVKLPYVELHPIDSQWCIHYDEFLRTPESQYGLPYINSLPAVDIETRLPWYLVNIYGQQREFETVTSSEVYNLDFGYDAGNTPNNFNLDVPQPQRFTRKDAIILKRGRAQPFDSQVKMSVYKTNVPADNSRFIRWGFNIDNFIVGGVFLPSNPAPDAIEPPDGVIEHINYEVFIAVNSVTITERNSGTAINFDNFSISRDLESFAWTTTFDVLVKDDFNVIRPQGRTVKTIDIDINGTIFTCVVTKSQLTQRLERNVYRCTGWTPIKLLSDPYSAKRSFTDNQTRTAAQIIDRELLGAGYDYTWSTVDWPVPIGVHSYQDKTPIGAILEVVNAVGAVIVPDTTEQRFDVQPYYPINPWLWGVTTPDRTINERQFFETTQETVINANSNSIFVYGEEISGVGVQVTRSGTAGDKILPDVVNKYMTANNAAQERGRVEICKNGFIETISMVTYVDTASGIIMPQELIRFTDTEDQTWYGMVLATTVNCSRVGTALRQTILVARYYDG